MSFNAPSLSNSTFIPIRSRRQNMRVAASIPVQLALGTSQYDFLDVTTVDIGMGGICVKTASIIDRTTIRAVRFSLGQQDFSINVESRWGAPGAEGEGLLTGLAFESLDPRFEPGLWRFIQERGGVLGSFIRGCEGLSSLSFQEGLELALETRLREVAAGQIIYGPDATKGGSSIFINFSGAALLERVSDRRHEEIATIHAGAIFGGLPIVAGYPPIERAIAISPVVLLEFDQFNCENMISSKPMLAAALFRAATFHWMCRFSKLLDQTYGAAKTHRYEGVG
jgi:CRP-like cAMP-binding protein